MAHAMPYFTQLGLLPFHKLRCEMHDVGVEGNVEIAGIRLVENGEVQPSLSASVVTLSVFLSAAAGGRVRNALLS